MKLSDLLHIFFLKLSEMLRFLSLYGVKNVPKICSCFIKFRCQVAMAAWWALSCAGNYRFQVPGSSGFVVSSASAEAGNYVEHFIWVTLIFTVVLK